MCVELFVTSSRYSALEVRDLDEVALLSEDGGGVGGSGSEGEESVWENSGSTRRTRWRRRIRSHTTLVSLLFNGGWLIVLKKWVECVCGVCQGVYLGVV